MAAPSLACRGFGRPALLLSLAAAAVAPRPLTSSLSAGLEQQASIRLVLEVLAGSLSLLHNRLRREHALCSSLRSEHAGEELRCRRWGTHRWRAARQADHACTIAKTRAANTWRFLAKKKGGARKEWPRMPTTFANSRPKLGRIWVITSGGVKHGPTGQLAEHLAPQALRWPTRWPTPEIFLFST